MHNQLYMLFISLYLYCCTYTFCDSCVQLRYIYIHIGFQTGKVAAVVLGSLPKSERGITWNQFRIVLISSNMYIYIYVYVYVKYNNHDNNNNANNHTYILLMTIINWYLDHIVRPSPGVLWTKTFKWDILLMIPQPQNKGSILSTCDMFQPQLGCSLHHNDYIYINGPFSIAMWSYRRVYIHAINYG